MKAHLVPLQVSHPQLNTVEKQQLSIHCIFNQEKIILHIILRNTKVCFSKLFQQCYQFHFDTIDLDKNFHFSA